MTFLRGSRLAQIGVTNEMSVSANASLRGEAILPIFVDRGTPLYARARWSGIRCSLSHDLD
jgi:hypothetical protein